MLATSIENATAGNYIYSSETNSISPDIKIEVHQYLTDVNYDLHRYTCSQLFPRVFETTQITSLTTLSMSKSKKSSSIH